MCFIIVFLVWYLLIIYHLFSHTCIRKYWFFVTFLPTKSMHVWIKQQVITRRNIYLLPIRNSCTSISYTNSSQTKNEIDTEWMKAWTGTLKPEHLTSYSFLEMKKKIQFLILGLLGVLREKYITSGTRGRDRGCDTFANSIALLK